MPLLKLLLAFSLVLMCYACKNNNKYPYAITDFRDSLQPHLTNILARGLVMYEDSALKNMASDEELARLSRCEHPLLRASAFREILRREYFEDLDISLEHLDDTSLVPVNYGEFGIRFQTVSDDILLHAEWKTEETQIKTIEKVLTKHNYLQEAYSIVSSVAPDAKYYLVIKDLATRYQPVEDARFDLEFDDTENALYGLAKFKKKEDVQFIKTQMESEVWQLSHVSFQLMEHYPDTAYMDVLEQYHRRQFYRFDGYRRGGFSSSRRYTAEPEDFMKALAAQQNSRSAALFDTILRRLPTITCMPGKKQIEDQLVLIIWENPSPAYAKLKQKIKDRAERILARRFSFSYTDSPAYASARAGGIRW